MTAAMSAWLQPPRLLAGCAWGLHHPRLDLSFALPALDARQRTAAWQWLVAATPEVDDVPPPPADPASDALGTVHLFLAGVLRLQRAARLPVFQPGVVLALQPEQARCQLPTPRNSAAALATAAEWLLACLAAQASATPERELTPAAPVVAQLAATAGAASNVPRLVAAAWRLGLPCQEIPAVGWQYGQGHRARWLDSTCTDATPNIATRLARDKVAAASILRLAGLPVANHQRVADEASALRAAEALGYPVVVKPADLDGGVGVAADLRSPTEVAQAFHAAYHHSPAVLVEKHIHGRDYRLTVFHDEVVWAIERVPGGVTGDGTSTVQQLLDALNADPRRGTGAHAPLKRLHWDDEAAALLAREGLTLASVPPAGQFLRLRRAANVASGGMPVGVFDRVHPHNIQLALRAARALRLDIAGIDLLIPDIARSWQETGAAICEVNSQPSLGQATAAHLYAPLLRRLVPGNGRIPLLVVAGAPPDSGVVRAVAQALAARGLQVGRHDAEGVWLNDELLQAGRRPPLAAGWMLLQDRRTQAAVLSVNDASALPGLPFGRFDLLLVAGSHFEASDASRQQVLAQLLLRQLLPACDGRVFTMTGSELPPAWAAQTPAAWSGTALAADEVVPTLTAEMLACERRHRQTPPPPTATKN